MSTDSVDWEMDDLIVPVATPAEPEFMPAFTRFDRLLIAVALRELVDRQKDKIRGLVTHVEKLAAKCNIDEDLWRRADQWIAEARE